MLRIAVGRQANETSNQNSALNVRWTALNVGWIPGLISNTINYYNNHCVRDHGVLPPHFTVDPQPF